MIYHTRFRFKCLTHEAVQHCSHRAIVCILRYHQDPTRDPSYYATVCIACQPSPAHLTWDLRNVERKLCPPCYSTSTHVHRRRASRNCNRICPETEYLLGILGLENCGSRRCYHRYSPSILLSSGGIVTGCTA